MLSSSFTPRVNMFLGTAGDHGQLYPGVEMPFGYVKPGPDTYPGAVKGSAHGGYDYDDTRMLGFSHLRFSGVGCEGVGGNILLLPTTNALALDPETYALPYQKDTEQAEPGYYRVVLGDVGVRVELTATNHVAMHRYTFPHGRPPIVLLDLGRGFNRVRDGHCMRVNSCEVAGEVTSCQMSCSGWYRTYFVIRFRRAFESFRFYPAGKHTPVLGDSRPDGSLVGMAFFSPKDRSPLVVEVALSPVSVDDARRNLEAETSGRTFETVRSQCRSAWNDVLGRIEVAGPKAYEDLLYSHLYRVHLSPFHVTGADGRYMGCDGEPHAAEGYTHYDGWSIWDTCRTKFPLLSLTEPGRMRDMMTSLTNMLIRRRTQVPDEVLFDCHGFSAVPTTRFELSNPTLLDAFQKGAHPLDPEATYALMAAVARMEFSGARERLGYVPRGPALTCEYAYDNWAAAEMAKALGKEADEGYFRTWAAAYRNVWDERIRFLRARDETGRWLDFPEDPGDVDEKYVYEGSMWHWRWAAVHDVAGLVELMGGREAFVSELTHFFENDLHNQGNEPGIHAPWMFAAAGAPWLSQKWVRTILTEPMNHRFGTHNLLKTPFQGVCFRNTPDGFIPEMDDDDGCMTAWYVFSSMGLFPVCVGRPMYVVGMPLFEETVVHNERGTDFRMVVKKAAEKNWYIQSARLNGADFTRPWIHHEEILKGGTLELEAGPAPNEAWGAYAHLPW